MPEGRAVSASTISVVMAVYDGERFVADAIRSIFAQTRRPLEVIVVDDGSNDRTGEIVRGFAAVDYVRRAVNGGQAIALNEGVARAKGEYLAFLDADDVWVEDKLERQRLAFDEDPSRDVVYGLLREKVIGTASAGVSARNGRTLPAYLPSAMLIRRAAFDTVGPFDTRFTLGSVVDWFARSREAGLREQLLPHVVYERRIHGDNVGLRHADRRSDYLYVVKAALDRRRLGAPPPAQVEGSNEADARQAENTGQTANIRGV